jgi:hypothetical protein
LEYHLMNMKGALVGIAALGGVALTSTTASAAMMPNPALRAGQASNVDQVRMVCNAWGRCWWRPNYNVGPAVRYGYVGPRYYGRGWGYRRGWGRRW